MTTLVRKVHEIRLVGRGGTGVVTAGELLGKAAVLDGAWAQAIPAFGPERRGALCMSTLRVSDRRILLKCATARPGFLLLLDATIWRHAPVTLGLAEGATLIFNSTAPTGVLANELQIDPGTHRILAVDATGIALDVLGRPITNTAMLGALVCATGLVAMDSLERVIEERFGTNAQKNIEAARAGAVQLAGRGD